MVMATGLDCDVDARRATLIAARQAGRDITGIDYIVVNGDQESLEVFFIDSEPPSALVTGSPSLFHITGGRRINVQVVDVGSTGGSPSSLHLDLSSPGDFSDYILEIDQPPAGSTVLDELYRRVSFNFKVDCPARFDCAPAPQEPEPPPAGIDVDYLAKDYASFRQALIDLIPRLSPQWTERLAADFGMTVLELLAYSADQLSYYQDAVANEAYLDTARQRVSVRRHARLVDYQMHDGASARTFVHFRLLPGTLLAMPQGVTLKLLTRIATPIGSEPVGTFVSGEDEEQAVALADAVFETFTTRDLDARLNELELYDWGDEGCVVPRGATSVDIRGDFGALLGPGDLLLLEEIADPSSGDTTLFDPDRRQVVRLKSVEGVPDNLAAIDVTRVTWDPADALAFPLTVRAANGITACVARGNILLADHGETVAEMGRTIDPIATGNRTGRFTLERGPLGFRPAAKLSGPATFLLDVDPHDATPLVSVRSGGDDWTPMVTLLEAGPYDAVVAVETGDDGRALLRFGDDVQGRSADPSDPFDVTYRIGVGNGGNIGAGALSHVVENLELPTLAAVLEKLWNPVPAWGGLEPESVAAVKSAAPAAFRARQDRAVTEADYARIAERHELVRAAVARFRWTGSWHTVFISIDPAGRQGLEAQDEVEITEFVDRYALAGYDIEIVPPAYVPVSLTLDICVSPEHFRPDVEQAVRRELSSGRAPQGRLGFFHPDNFTFGQPLYLSRLYARVAAVDGVDSVVATKFARLFDDEPDSGGDFTEANLDRGSIPMGPLEIARLDDDPDFPENGLLQLKMLGGK